MDRSGTPIHRIGPNFGEFIGGAFACSVFVTGIAWTLFAAPWSRWLVAAVIDLPLVLMVARSVLNSLEFYDEVIVVKGLFRNEVVSYASIVRVVYHPHVYAGGPVVRIWFDTGVKKWRIHASHHRLEGTFLPSLLEHKGIKVEVR